MERSEINRLENLIERRKSSSGRQTGKTAELMNSTQGHLILRWNAWRPPGKLREIGLPALYCFVALFFFLFFALESFLQFHQQYARVLLGFALLTVCAYIYARLGGNRHVTNTFLVVLWGALCVFLLYTGGIEDTGPLWYFVFPLFALFVLRLWAGVLAVVLLLGVTLFLMLHPVAGFDPGQYTEAFRQRFLAVYISISLMAFFYAFIRASVELDFSNLAVEFQDMAETDVLTRLPNRRRMLATLYQEVSRTRRTKGVFSLIMMDMDKFKNINDLYGHDCGDAVLCAVPGIAHKALRSVDVIARWGGEEFMVLLPGTALPGAVQVAERLRAAVERHQMTYAGTKLNVTASFGVCEFHPDDELSDCIKNTDARLYKAKGGGRNRVEST